MKLLDTRQGAPATCEAPANGFNLTIPPDRPRHCAGGYVWGHFETRAKKGRALPVVAVVTVAGFLMFRTAGRPTYVRPDWN